MIPENKVVKIPNNEVRNEYVNSVAASDWGEVSIALKQSADTLNAIWQRRPQQVAEGIQLAHFETSHIQYNDEKRLELYDFSCFICGKEFLYNAQELAGGKGFGGYCILFHVRNFRINRHLW